MSEVIESQRSHLFYTWTAQKEAAPLEIVGGQGARFQTADGAWWWDLGSTTWNANLGHGHPQMRARLAEAAAVGLVAGPAAAFPDKARAGRLLAEITPAGLSKSFICLSGTEANENAIKMAKLVTGRSKIVARRRSYHGASLAMLSLSGDPRREAFEPGLPGVVRLADSYCFRCQFGQQPDRCQLECASDLERAVLEADPTTVAAVIVEGVTGANGVFPSPAGYFRRLRQLCDQYGVLLIVDEVLSGFGRTGRWFAIDHEGVSPDLLTCAKGLTGGYAPGGAVVVSERVAQHFEDQVLFCGLTTYAHPLVCGAICAAIDCYREEGLIEKAATTGRWLQPQLRELQARQPWIADVRGQGLLWALELVDPQGQPASPQVMQRIYASLKQRKVHLHRRDHFLYLAPPLVIETEELQTALGMVEATLEEVLGP